jgi:hypothetical protein
MENKQVVDTSGDVKIVQDFAKTQLINKITQSFNDLVVEPSKEISRLPESVFVGYFLPFFCGEKTQKENPKIFAEWISIAGSPVKEVQIVDDVNRDLFVVPGLMDSSVIDKLNDRGTSSLLSIFTNYELHKAHLPVLGESYLANSLEQKIPTMTKSSEMIQENSEKWQHIFIRYGKVKQDKPKTVTQPVDEEMIIDDE